MKTAKSSIYKDGELFFKKNKEKKLKEVNDEINNSKSQLELFKLISSNSNIKVV